MFGSDRTIGWALQLDARQYSAGARQAGADSAALGAVQKKSIADAKAMGAAQTQAASGLTKLGAASKASAAPVRALGTATTGTRAALTRLGTAGRAVVGAIGTGLTSAAAGARRALGTMGASLTTAGGAMQRLGASTRNISLFLAGAVGAAAKAGFEFDRTFSTITGLVGIAAEEVDAMKTSTLALAGATAQAPEKLASAMFTLQSAGLRGKLALDALEQSARLSAGGMGEVRDIAQATTSILDQYAKSGTTAAEAADFLAGTARAGNFESSQLAGSLGKVLPVASNLGIALADVGGAVALLTRGNGNAAESITQVAAVMRVLLAPSSEARKLLEDVGLTMQDVKDVASGPGGLVGALELLQDATGGNDETLARLLGSSEAVSAAFQILAADNKTIADTFGAVANSAGVANEVFEAAANTDSFKAEKALNDLRVAAVKVGAEVGPAIASAVQGIAGAAAGATEAFSNLDPAAKGIVTDLTAVAVVAPVASIALGKVASTLGAAATAGRAGGLGAAVKSLTGMGPAGIAAAAGLGLVGALLVTQRAEARRFEDNANRLTAALAEQGDTSVTVSEQFRDLVDTLGDLTRAEGEAIEGAEGISDAFTGEFLQGFSRDGRTAVTVATELGLSLSDITDLASSGRNPGLVVKDFAESMREAARSGRDLPDDYILLQGALGELALAYATVTAETEQANRETIELALGFGQLTDAELESALAAADAAGAVERYTFAEKELTPILQQRAFDQDLATGATVSFSDALAATTTQYADYSAGLQEVSDATDTFTGRTVLLTKDSSDLEIALSRLNEEYQDQYLSVNDAANATKLYKQIIDEMTGSQRRLDSVMESTQSAFDNLIESQDIGDLRAAGLAIEDQTFALLENGESIAVVLAKQDQLQAQLRDVATEAGLTETEIDELIRVYGNVPRDIITELALQTGSARQEAIEFTQENWQAFVSIVLDRQSLENARSVLASLSVVGSPVGGAADAGAIGGGAVLTTRAQTIQPSITRNGADISGLFGPQDFGGASIYGNANALPAGFAPSTGGRSVTIEAGALRIDASGRDGADLQEIRSMFQDQLDTFAAELAGT